MNITITLDRVDMVSPAFLQLMQSVQQVADATETAPSTLPIATVEEVKKTPPATKKGTPKKATILEDVKTTEGETEEVLKEESTQPVKPAKEDAEAVPADRNSILQKAKVLAKTKGGTVVKEILSSMGIEKFSDVPDDKLKDFEERLDAL